MGRTTIVINFFEQLKGRKCLLIKCLILFQRGGRHYQIGIEFCSIKGTLIRNEFLPGFFDICIRQFLN